MNEQNCVSESGESSVESTFPECEVVPVVKRPVSRANPVHTIERTARSAETMRAINRSLGVSHQLSETMRAINRPLAVSHQLSETMRAINRSLGVSHQLSETMRAINRPLAVSQQLSETINAMSRPVVSRQLSETINAMSRPVVSRQLSETINAMSRPVVSRQLSETINAMSRPVVSRQLSETINAMSRPVVSRQLSETINAMSRPVVSRQLSETINAMSRPVVSRQLSETINAMSRPVVNPWSMGGIISFNRRLIPAMAHTPSLVKTEEEPQAWPDSLRVKDDDCLLLEEASFWITQFDVLVTDDGLRRCSRSLFVDGYYSLAVQRAYIYIDNLVSKRSGRADKDGADLMRTVFSPKNPVLKLNKLESRSEENQQQGYMHIFEGIMIGIRNPRVHEYAIEDPPRDSLEMLVLANHLIRMLKGSTLA